MFSLQASSRGRGGELARRLWNVIYSLYIYSIDLLSVCATVLNTKTLKLFIYLFIFFLRFSSFIKGKGLLRVTVNIKFFSFFNINNCVLEVLYWSEKVNVVNH